MQLPERIIQALQLTDGEAELHPHTSWEVCHLLSMMKPSDLNPPEMMAMAVILAHANARKRGTGPLKVVPLSSSG